MKTGVEIAGRLYLKAAVRLISLVGLTVVLALSARAQVWSPDSQKVIFGGAALTQVDISTLAPQPKLLSPLPQIPIGIIVMGSGPGIWPVLSPDNKTLAYLADSTKLTILDMITHQSRRPDDRGVSPIAWSPDSQFFAYVHSDDKGSLEYRSVHANGDLAVSIALPFTKITTGTMQTIAWIPTTDNVIIAGGDGVKTDLYLIDQGQVVQLTNTGDVQGFGVSSNGERVRWVRRSTNTHYILLSIYDLVISKRTALKLDFPDRLPGINPQPRSSVDAVTSVIFSPDLTRIAFVTRGGQGDGVNGVSLYISDVQGKNVRLLGKGKALGLPAIPVKPADNNQLTAPPAIPVPVTPSVQTSAPGAGDATGLSFPALAPVFSPDSKQLCVLRVEGDKRYVYVFNAEANSRSVGLLP